MLFRSGYTNFSLSRTPDINTSSVLTDGFYASTFTNMDPYWMGYKYSGSQNNHVTMDFDLYSPGSISQIVLSSKHDPARKVTIPQNLTLSVANGQGQWIELKAFSNTPPSSASPVKMTWDSMAALSYTHLRSGAEGKPSLNRAAKLLVYDPKPGDLSMVRLKWE